MDAFFAQVEQRDNPELKGKPVAVGGEIRGVVSAASYEARKYGVHSAMPTFRAKQLCPKLIIIKPHFEKYIEVSKKIREIFKEYTDLVEPLSLDEAFLDVTSNKKEIISATYIAYEIKQKIKQKLSLTASAGVSFNKFLAKVGSSCRKPDGLTLIDSEHAQPFLDKLPIQKFFGIGKATTKKMHAQNIYYGKDIRELGEKQMSNKFGKFGKFYYNLASCNDNREVNPTKIRKSIGIERTFFSDLKNEVEVIQKIENLNLELWQRINKNQTKGKTLTLKIKFNNFHVITRAKTKKNFFTDELQTLQMAKKLLPKFWLEKQKIRLLGLSLSNLNK